MLTREPGWHPDPDGGRQVRFWDGEEWTEYVQPLSPEAARKHGPETAVVDYPYLSEANVTPAREPRIVDTWKPEVVTAFATAPGRSRRRRSALPWWIAAGGLALVLVVVGVVTAMRSTNSPVLADPSPSSTVTAGSPVTVGQSVTVTVPSAGTGVVTIQVSEPGSYLVEAVAASEDISGALLSGDQVLWQVDDRGNELADVIGGTWSDPAGFVELEAGEYTFEVSEHDAKATTAEVFLYPVDTVDVSTAAPTTVTLPEGEYVVLRLPLDAEQRLAIDVRGSGSWDDPQITYFPGGVSTLSGDRGAKKASDLGGSEWDPYLEATFPAGVSFLVLSEYAWDQIDTTVTVTPVP
ncbi:DUF2510 domain-containing protein [Salana multivorans]